ncbi:hypothetical protein [Limosilactobacillus antri]|uniref:hypothetical protein n=1 Tax=Limosilactobacillus antri TaxID=227943 RepID=UPI001F586423|nr:hypothetical protein [Limosilactobacillus antri]
MDVKDEYPFAVVEEDHIGTFENHHRYPDDDPRHEPLIGFLPDYESAKHHLKKLSDMRYAYFKYLVKDDADWLGDDSPRNVYIRKSTDCVEIAVDPISSHGLVREGCYLKIAIVKSEDVLD